MAIELIIHHLGRLSRATVRGGDTQSKKFINSLLLNDFIITAERENHLELRRRAYLLQDDWPMRVNIYRNGSEFQIDYYLCIPWSWIAGLTFLTWVALPFAGFQNAELAFVLALLVATLAVYKQKFDCRPNARFWQERARQRWNETMERLVREAFDRP
ncbi:MAG TPA: hypothetical protein P5149_01030 [Candidatus Competibacteraceae bacterium]|nr:hypothetical protein [Candidatus Competibacteraceae bacterium]